VTELSPAWVSVLPEEDYQHSFGLKAGSAEKFFAPTERHADLLAQRRHWLRTDTARCAALLPGAEPLLEETIALARSFGAPVSDPARSSIASQNAGSETGAPTEAANAFARCLALGEAWEADYLLLKQDAADGRFHLLGGCVCFPSSWRFEEKVGKPLEVIHTPVPHLNEQLASPIHNFLSRIKPGAAWCRANWGLSRSPELNQHPARGLPKLRPPLREDEVWLRVEDQALVALPESRGVLFGIRMTVIPLAEVKRHPAAARGLARALRTMPDAMLEYKSLLAAKEELLRLLAVG
jgi:dimethylamine monooxygenase subunit A